MPAAPPYSRRSRAKDVSHILPTVRAEARSIWAARTSSAGAGSAATGSPASQTNNAV